MKLPRGYWPETEGLARRFRRGERYLVWELVGRLEPVVRRTARAVREAGDVFWVEDEELLQIGRLEAADVLEGYDPDAGARIDSYVGQWLFHRVLRGAHACAPVRTAAGIQDGDLAERAVLMLGAARHCAPAVPEDAFVAEETGFEEVMLEDSYRRFATGADLPDSDARVLAARFGLGGADEKTLAEVAGEFGRSREWARQREEKALAAVRERNRQSYGISVRLVRGAAAEVLGPSPAVSGGYFSLGQLSVEPERSISSPGEWAGEILPFKRTPAGGPARYEPDHGQEGFTPAPRRRASAGSPAERACRALEEDGVVRASDVAGPGGDSKREAVVRNLRAMGLVEVAAGYWAVPLSPAACRATRRTLREFGPQRLKELLVRLRFHPAVRAADLPAAAAFGPLLRAHPDFSVGADGLVRAAGGAGGPSTQAP